MRRWHLIAVLTLALTTGGCWFKKRKPDQPPLPPPQPPSVSERPAIEEPNPKQSPTQQPLPPLPLPQQQEQPPPPPQDPVVRLPGPKTAPSPAAAKPRRRSSSRDAAPKAAEPEPPVQPAAPPAAPLPQLGVILSPEERKALEQEYARRVKSAKALLIVASNRKLEDPHKEIVQRIESFLQQAQDQVARDLSTAVQLARRAEVLAQELYDSLP